MDDDYPFLAQRCQEAIEGIAFAVDELAPPLVEAAACITQAFLQEGRLFTCGNGPDAALAQLIASRMLAGFEQERPALPAMALAADSSSLGSLASRHGLDEVFAQSLRALAHSGDILLCICSGSVGGNLLRALEVARERDMTIVVLSSARDGSLADKVEPGEVLLPCAGNTLARVTELQILALHLLCELVERNLFGHYHGN
ncbi:D-sedoheptulose-7-phosphate isomerase [Haliea atlantica]